MNRHARPYITQLRNRELPMDQFRAAADKLAQLMAFEAEVAVPSQTISIETPLVATNGVLSHQNVVLIPILRSGSALQDTFKNHFRTARVGMIGMKRDEKTAIAETYLQNLPEITAEDRVLILEPMIATGGSLSTALSLLASRGVKPEQILIVSFIAAPQGLLRLHKAYPAVRILVAQIDVTLNEHKFIVPGLGDFGDRYFGT
ncbi:MAG: uracil phosphoribosyltransferase [Parachlamydia sp.]|nr:uracil phosphoribosyltransferase [Parachlamydia sp.]